MEEYGREERRSEKADAAVSALCVLCLVVTDAVTRSPFSACSSSLPNAQGSRKRHVCVQCLKAKEDLTGCGTGVTPCFCVCVGWYGSPSPALLETEQSKSE